MKKRNGTGQMISSVNIITNEIIFRKRFPEYYQFAKVVVLYTQCSSATNRLIIAK